MKRAFDSVNHFLLWHKLHALGLSTKFINLIKSLYSNANIKAKVNNNFTNEFPIGEGVLQGETLSPSLFSLFIHDIEAFFRSRYVKGVKINEQDDVLLLCYADDIVIFATSEWDVQNKLDILFEYCNLNKLSVNTDKTKILPFHRSNKTIQFRKFNYNGANIEVVKNYTYLGVQFSFNGKFLEATNCNISKGKVAAANTRAVLARSKSDCWLTKKALFKSTVQATLLYASEIWALRYLNKIETVQLQFYKSLLYWPKNTPSFVVRFETASDNLEAAVLHRALKLWSKLDSMEDCRIPKKCFQALKILDSKSNNIDDFNWVSQVKNLLSEYKITVAEFQSTPIADIIGKVVSTNKEMDYQRCCNSNFNPIYKYLTPHNTHPEYLAMRTNFARTRTVSQLRVAGRKYITFYWGNISYKIKLDEICTVCNTGEPESIEHFLFVCPMYSSLRHKYLEMWLTPDLNSNENLIKLLSFENLEMVNDTFSFIIGALKTRSFVLEE